MIRLILIITILFMYNNSYATSIQISNLITPVIYFVDHIKQLNKLRDSLIKHKKASVVGISGIGKTQLVRTYAYENKNQYDILWFFDCNLDLNQEFIRLAKHLNKTINASLSEDLRLVQKEVMDYLKSQDKWLLVFDNLKIGENIKVKDLIEWEHNGHVIFASQDKHTLPNTIELTVLDKDDAITLVNNLLENKNDVDFLVKAFDNYPILMTQGSQLLNQIKGLDREEYKKKIYQASDKLQLNIELAAKRLNPNANKLLRKIALINNQRFSKELLNIITDDKVSISEDVYQLSKFMLISNVDNNENNPVFEMHDIIAQKVIEFGNEKSNKSILEDIISKFTEAMPVSFHKSHILRNTITIPENFEIVAQNAQKYGVGKYYLLQLNLHLMSQYIHSLNYYENAEKIVNWFDANEREGNFKMWRMDNKERSEYANFLAIIGWYYRTRCADWSKSIEYLTRAKKVMDEVNGYESSKFNISYQLSVANVALGNKPAAESNIVDMEEMQAKSLIDKGDIGFLHYAKARVLVIQGKYLEALEMIDKTIEPFTINGVKSTDLVFTNPYLRRAEVLNALGRFSEALDQSVQLYEMHKPTKATNHEIFGRIYTWMAKAELGLGKIDEAQKHVKESIAIFLEDKQRNPQNVNFSGDVDLAYSYVVQGDIYLVLGKLETAVNFYRQAQGIFLYLYKENMNNVAHVSDLYLKGAKAACRLKDLYHYKAFGLPQVREFGREHPNTIAMYEYCKDYNMNLWQKDGY